MLDLFSILVVFFIVTVISVITLFVIKWQYGKEYSGLDEWFYGFLCMAIGFFIIVFLNRIPYIPGMLMSNYLLMSGLVIVYVGVARFFNRQVHYKRQIAILASAFLLYLAFTFINNSLVLRNIVLTTVFIIVFAQTLTVLVSKSKKDNSAVNWSIIIFILALLASTGRLVSFIFAPQNVEHYHNYTSTFEIGTIIAYLSLILLLLLSLLLLLANRLLKDALKAEDKFKESFKLSPDGLILYRLSDGEIIEVNASFLKMVEATRDELITHPVWSSEIFDESTQKTLKTRPKNITKETKWSFDTTKGERHALVRSSLILVNDTAHILASFEDITTVIELQKTFEKMASHDPLTDLPNRRHFEQHFEKTMDANHPYAVAIGDIDNFKNVNDEYGHDYGDEVLRIFASRIMRNLGENELAARFGGDEFVLFLDSVESQSDTNASMQSIVDELRKPFEIDGETIEISMSFGIVHAQENKDLKELLKTADKAMYKAKSEESYYVLTTLED